MALTPAAAAPLGKNCYVARMTMMFRSLASGAGWRAADIVCDAGPDDRPFEEQRSDVAIAVVTDGTFQYRTAQGGAVLERAVGDHSDCDIAALLFTFRRNGSK